MNVLSVFDGMSCGREALERAGIPVTKYYASEIDKYAIRIAKLRWPDIVHIGDVRRVVPSMLPLIHLLIGGSPCQGFSFAGKRLNLKDPRSKLVFKYAWLLKKLKAINPDLKFMLENVCMDKRSEGIITDLVGVHPIKINSALVSAQNRERLYWTNIGDGYLDLTGCRVSLIPQPKDRGILLKDIIEDGAVDREKSYCIDANYMKGGGRGELLEQGQTTNNIRKLGNVNPSGNGMNGYVFDIEGKSPTLTTNKGEGVKVGRMAGVSISKTGIRPYTAGGMDCKRSAPSDMKQERPLL